MKASRPQIWLEFVVGKSRGLLMIDLRTGEARLRYCNRLRERARKAADDF